MNGTLEFLARESAAPLVRIVVPLVIVLGLVAWKRSGFRLGVGLLELLRLAMVALVLFALHQPEIVHRDASTQLPRVAVLWDDSGSMDTRDVLTAGAAGPVSRGEWLASQLEAEALAQRLEGRFRVTVGPYSGDPADHDPSGPEPDGTAPAPGEDHGLAATDMAGPLERLLEDPTLRALVLCGDGDWNSGGDPAAVAMRYRMRDVPILTATVGSRSALPDVEFLPLEPPAFALVERPLAVPIAIRSAMDRDLRLTVSLTDSSGQEVREEVFLQARSTYEGTLNLTPRTVGELTLRAEVPVQAGELDATNNAAEARIEVREESLRVLLVESYPRWEYRYLRNAMVRDPGVEVDCYLFHPDLSDVGGGPHYLETFPGREALSDYDVVFVGDVGLEPDQLTEDQCADLRGLVAEQASGLILMPGLGGRQLSLYHSALEPLIPVELDPAVPYGNGSRVPARLHLTEVGRRSALTQLAPDERENARLWEDLPGFQWHAAVRRARAGSSVLAVHSSRDDGLGRLPLLVTKNFGTGKVLFMGTDGAWRWREGLEDRIHYRFWSQVIRWMAYQRKMNAGETMRLFYSPDRPDVRSLTTLFANVMDAAGAPLSGADVSARIESPSGQVSRLRFDPDEGEWGLYRSTFRPQEPGEHEIVLTCRETQEQLLATLSVTGAALERVGQPARHDVMAELARVSRGGTILPADLARVEERLIGLGTPPEVSRRTRLWSHPLLGALMVLLMASFWIGRKAIGRF